MTGFQALADIGSEMLETSKLPEWNQINPDARSYLRLASIMLRKLPEKHLSLEQLGQNIQEVQTYLLTAANSVTDYPDHPLSTIFGKFLEASKALITNVDVEQRPNFFSRLSFPEPRT